MQPRLKLYTGEEVDSFIDPPNVNVRFGEILTALIHAWRCNRTWLHDFEDDEIQVSQDLYEVISAYNHLRPSA